MVERHRLDAEGAGQGALAEGGQAALLDFSTEVTLDGDPLTPEEITELLAKTDGLALVRGQWIELDRKRLAAMIDRFREVEQTAKRNGIAFGEAMRLLAGATVAEGDIDSASGAEWAQVTAGPRESSLLSGRHSNNT